MTTAPVHGTPAICTACARLAKPWRPLGESDTWQCSHAHCPHRPQLTAAPSEQAPLHEDDQ